MRNEGMRCSLCNVVLTNPVEIESHFTGKKHRKNQHSKAENPECQSKSIFISRVGSLNLTSIQEYFSQYGTVCNILVFNDTKLQNRIYSVIIEFENEKSVEDIIPGKKKRIHQVPKLGTIPVQIQSVTVTERIMKSRPARSPSPTRAEDISFSVIKLQLSLVLDLDEQMERIVDLIQLNQEDISNRRLICVNISKTFCRQGYPACVLYPFGSTVNGLGFQGCDMDVYLDLGEIPSFESSKKNPLIDVPVTLNEVQKVKIAANILRTIPQCSRVFSISNCRVPIVKFVHRPTGINCDISFKNKLSVFNSEFIRFCTQVDSRVRPLMMAVKLFGKRHNISGGGGGTRLSNYALAMLVILYLQQLDQPLLHSVHTLQEYLDCDPEYINGWNVSFASDLDRLPSLPVNKQGHFELLHGFFTFYSTLDISKFFLSPYLGRLVSREEISNTLPQEFQNMPKFLGADKIQLGKAACLQDPFELSHNVTKNLAESTVLHLQTIFRCAADICLNLRTPGSNTRGGFNRLIDMEVGEHQIDLDSVVQQLSKTRGIKANFAFQLHPSHHTVEKVEEIISNIFQTALMFQSVDQSDGAAGEEVVEVPEPSVTNPAGTSKPDVPGTVDTRDPGTSEPQDPESVDDKIPGTAEEIVDKVPNTSESKMESSESEETSLAESNQNQPTKDDVAMADNVINQAANDDVTEVDGATNQVADDSVAAADDDRDETEDSRGTNDKKRKSEKGVVSPMIRKKSKSELSEILIAPKCQIWRAKFPVWKGRRKYTQKYQDELAKCSFIQKERRITEKQMEELDEFPTDSIIQFKCYLTPVKEHWCMAFEVVNTKKKLHEDLFAWLRSFVPDLFRKVLNDNSVQSFSVQQEELPASQEGRELSNIESTAREANGVDC